MCRVLDLPVGTFYNYHLRRVDTTQNQIRDEYLKEEIIKIFNESGQRFCAPKIATKLSELGIKTTKEKVSNLMKQMGIKSKQCKKRTFEKKQGKLASCKNYLNRHFEQSEPNKFWVGDVTTIFIKNNKFYLCVIIDLFSRKVVAYRLSAQNNSNLTVNTFKELLLKHKVHDKKRQYTQCGSCHSDGFIEACSSVSDTCPCLEGSVELL